MGFFIGEGGVFDFGIPKGRGIFDFGFPKDLGDLSEFQGPANENCYEEKLVDSKIRYQNSFLKKLLRKTRCVLYQV